LQKVQKFEPMTFRPFVSVFLYLIDSRPGVSYSREMINIETECPIFLRKNIAWMAAATVKSSKINS